MEVVAAKTVLDLDQIHTLKVANSPKLLLGTTLDSAGGSGSGGSIKIGLSLSGKFSGLPESGGPATHAGNTAATDAALSITGVSTMQGRQHG